MATLGSLIVKITTDIKEFTQGLDRVQKSTTDLGKFAATAGDVAGKAFTAIGIAASAVGVNATRMAMDFETSFAGVKKTMDATPEQFAVLSQAMRDLAQEIPVNVNELNKIGETAGAMGIAHDKAKEFTKVIAEMASTTELSSDAAARAFGQISTLMGLAESDFSRLGSAIVDLGNKGESTEPQITEMALRLVGAGKTVGMTTAEILSLAASMANVGIEAEKGGTAMSKLMINIASDVATGGDAVKGWAEVSGMSVDQFVTAFQTNAADAIKAFIGGLTNIQQSGGNLFKTLEDLDIKETRLRDTTLLLATAGEKLNRDLTTGRTAWEANSALAVEAGKRYETSASQLQIFQNRLSDTQITLGTALIPVFMKALDLADPFIQTLKSMAEGFASLDPVTQTFIAAITGISTVAYPAIIAIASFSRAIQTLIPLVTSLYGLILAHPFVAIGVAVAALAILIYKHWDEIHAATNKLAKAFNAIITAGLDPVISSITKARDTIINLCKQISDGVKTYLSDKLLAIFDKVKGGIEDVKGYFKGLYHAVVGGSYIPDMVEEIGDHMRNLDITMTAPARNAVVNTGRVIMEGSLTWGMAISQFASTSNQTWGSISSTAATNLAKMTDETVAWGDVVKQMGIQLMTNMITLVIGLATQWAIGQAMQTASAIAGDTARVVSNSTANAAMLASNTASATASTSIWGGAGSAISGFFAMIAGGFKAIALGLIVAVKAVGTFVMGVLSAIAGAMKATIFGIPVGIAILAGVIAIAVALAATGNIPGLAEGGMVMGPTTANIAEGGSPEAVIPLNDRGAKFMQSAMGMGGNGSQQINLYLDSKLLTKTVVKGMPNVIHTKLGYT